MLESTELSESTESSGFVICPRNLSKSTNKGALQHNANHMARFKRKLHQHIMLSFIFAPDSYYSPKELKQLIYKLKHQNLPDDIKKICVQDIQAGTQGYTEIYKEEIIVSLLSI